MIEFADFTEKIKEGVEKAAGAGFRIRLLRPMILLTVILLTGSTLRQSTETG